MQILQVYLPKKRTNFRHLKAICPASYNKKTSAPHLKLSFAKQLPVPVSVLEFKALIPALILKYRYRQFFFQAATTKEKFGSKVGNRRQTLSRLRFCNNTGSTDTGIQYTDTGTIKIPVLFNSTGTGMRIIIFRWTAGQAVFQQQHCMTCMTNIKAPLFQWCPPLHTALKRNGGTILLFWKTDGYVPVTN